MSSQLTYWFFLLLFPFAGWMLGIVLRRIFRKRSAAAKPIPDQRCVCGYSLKNLSVPRCPECGRVIGFNATAEELGLSTAELEKIHTARRLRNPKSDS